MGRRIAAEFCKDDAAPVVPECPACVEKFIALARKYEAQNSELLVALKKHVCVRAIQGDGMNAVDYYPVDPDDCALCIAIWKAEAMTNRCICELTIECPQHGEVCHPELGESRLREINRLRTRVAEIAEERDAARVEVGRLRASLTKIAEHPLGLAPAAAHAYRQIAEKALAP